MLWWTLRQLRSKQSEIREQAAKRLGNLRDARAVAPLANALNDDYLSVHEAAAQALGKIGDARAVEPLVTTLSNRKGGQRVIEALGMIKDSRAVPALVDTLKHDDANLREAVAVALGKIGNPDALEPLMEALEDINIHVRRAAEEALIKIDPNWSKTEAAKAALPRLISKLTKFQDNNYGVQQDELEMLLNKINPNWSRTKAAQAAVPTLIAKLDSSPERAIALLNKIDRNWYKAEATQTLIPTLISKLPQQEAWEVLEMFQPHWTQSEAARASVPSLLAAYTTAYPAVQEKIVSALIRICQTNIEPMIVALKNPNRSIRSAAAQVLREIGDHRTAAHLSSAIEKEADSFVLEEFARTAQKIGSQQAIQSAVERLADKLKGKDFFIRVQEARILKSLGWQPANDTERAIVAIALEQWSELLMIGSAATELLITTLEHNHYQHEVAQVLGKIRDVRAVKPLLKLASNSNFGEVAIEALEQVLRHSIMSVGVEDLQLIAQLENIIQTEDFVTDLGGEGVIKHIVDCSQVKYLAQQELNRRGLNKQAEKT